MPKPPVPAEIDAFLAKPNPCVIATLRPDGSPVTVATWYDWEGGRVLVNMDESRSRLEHLHRDPRVAITILDAASWYSHVLIRGRVVKIRPDPDLTDIDCLSQRYQGRPHGNRGRRSVTALIAPEHWFAWGVSPGG